MLSGNYVVTVIPKPAPEVAQEQVSRFMRRLDEERVSDIPPIQNVHFPHNPNWRNESFVSIQNAHDAKGSWAVIWVLWGGAQGAFMLGDKVSSILAFLGGALFGLNEVLDKRLKNP